MEAAEDHLVLDGRIALETGNGHHVHKIESQLGKLRYLALDEKGDLFRVEAYGEVVECNLDHILTHLLRIVDIVGKSLCICNEHKHLAVVSRVLESDPVPERTDIVANVEPAGGPVARKYYLF